MATAEQPRHWPTREHRDLFETVASLRTKDEAQRFLREMFQAYVEDARLLPPEYQERAATEGLHRVLCDYIAGMTDRFAEQEYRRLFHPFEKT